jgi:predicted enzyme related to lactoylglutathione lyase
MALTLRPGSFCWFELSTTDQSDAKRFYESLLGWTSNDSPIGPSEMYTIFNMDGRAAGACFTMQPEQRSQGIPPHWLVYVMVENADAAASRAASLGGSVVAPPFDVMEAGRMAIVSDPTGAMVALWQPKDHAGIGVWAEPRSVGWADLQTRDQGKAAAFYSDLFGWKMVEGKSPKPAKPGDYYHIMNGDDMIGGIPPPGQVDPHVPPHWMIYIEIADCKAATAKALSLGGRAYVDTMEIPDAGRISVVADPQGAVFGLHQTTP